MKMSVTVLSFLLAFSSLAAESAEVKKPVIRVPRHYTSEVSVWPKEVMYRVEAKEAGLYCVFLAGSDARLKNLRIGRNDQTVFEWEVIYDSAGKPALSGPETGESFSNTVSIDKEKWLRFFARKVALPKFEIRADRSLTEIEDNGLQWQFVGYVTDGVQLKTDSSQYLRTVTNADLLFPVPTTGKFFLANKNGLVCPVVMQSGQWVVPVMPDVFPVSRREAAKN